MKAYKNTPFTVFKFRDPSIAEKAAIAFDAGIVGLVDDNTNQVVLSFEGNLFEEAELTALEARIELAGKRLFSGEETVARSVHPITILRDLIPIGTWDEERGFEPDCSLSQWNPPLCALIQRVKMIHPDAQIFSGGIVGKARENFALGRARFVVTNGSLTDGPILGSGATREEAWRKARGTGALTCPAGPNSTRLRLILDVEYERNGVSPTELIRRLGKIPHDAAGEGGFTGSTDAEVESWTSRVEVLCGS